MALAEAEKLAALSGSSETVPALKLGVVMLSLSLLNWLSRDYGLGGSLYFLISSSLMP